MEILDVTVESSSHNVVVVGSCKGNAREALASWISTGDPGLLSCIVDGIERMIVVLLSEFLQCLGVRVTSVFIYEGSDDVISLVVIEVSEHHVAGDVEVVVESLHIVIDLGLVTLMWVHGL